MKQLSGEGDHCTGFVKQNEKKAHVSPHFIFSFQEALENIKFSLQSIKNSAEGADDLRGRGWSGGAMVLGKLPVPGRPTILITVGQGPTALAVGAGGGGLDIFTLICPFSSFSLYLGDGPI